MAYPSDLVRTKNWGTEILTDGDLEGQLDLIINWIMASFNASSGHGHTGAANDGPIIGIDDLSLAGGTAFQRYRVNAAATKVETIDPPTRCLSFFVDGTLATGTRQSISFRSPFAGTIVGAYAAVVTAPTVSSILIDINKGTTDQNGTTIWATQGNRLAILATATEGHTTTFDTTAVAIGDWITMDIDQVGTVAGAKLSVNLYIKENV